MRKITLLLVTAFSIAGCQKEQVEPTPSLIQECESNCGFIVDMQDEETLGPWNWQVTIRNECTGNEKDFAVGHTYYYTNSLGGYTCMTNEDTW